MTEEDGNRDNVEVEVFDLEDELIDDAWETLETVVEGLADNPVQEYEEFNNASDILNYVENELLLREQDINRVLEEYRNAKCPECEDRNLYKVNHQPGDERVDPTLAKSSWTTEHDSFKQGEDKKTTNHFLAYCPRHDEVYLLLEETRYNDET